MSRSPSRSGLKFLLDENVHNGLAEILTSLRHDAAFSEKGANDTEVSSQAITENRILLTRDDDFLASRFTAPRHFGIILLRVEPRDIEGQSQAIAKLLKAHPKANWFKRKAILITPRGNPKVLSTKDLLQKYS